MAMTLTTCPEVHAALLVKRKAIHAWNHTTNHLQVRAVLCGGGSYILDLAEK